MIDNKIIWFDFDNAPHVPVLLPIVKEMRNRGYGVIMTARDKAETKELLYLNKEEFFLIGKDFPKNKFLKVFFTFKRSIELIFFLKTKKNIILSVSHSSRSALFASWMKRIPSVALYDYEYVNSLFQNTFATKVLMPNVFNKEDLIKSSINIKNIKFYPGIKEQIYIDKFHIKKNLFCNHADFSSKIIVLFRPPGTTGHYHNPKSEIIMNEILEKIEKEKNKIILIFLPRTKNQKEKLSLHFKEKSIPFLLLNKPADGIDLILSSDLVLSGGGTMIREAAVLGIPSYSFFQGPKGAVDKYLEDKERLIFINSKSNVEKIEFKKKQKEENILEGNPVKIISYICDILESTSLKNVKKISTC